MLTGFANRLFQVTSGNFSLEWLPSPSKAQTWETWCLSEVPPNYLRSRNAQLWPLLGKCHLDGKSPGMRTRRSGFRPSGPECVPGLPRSWFSYLFYLFPKGHPQVEIKWAYLRPPATWAYHLSSLVHGILEGGDIGVWHTDYYSAITNWRVT